MNGKRAKALRKGVGYKLKHWRSLSPKQAYNIEEHRGGMDEDRWVAYQIWCKGQRSWYKKAKQIYKELKGKKNVALLDKNKRRTQDDKISNM